MRGLTRVAQGFDFLTTQQPFQVRTLSRLPLRQLTARTHCGYATPRRILACMVRSGAYVSATRIFPCTADCFQAKEKTAFPCSCPYQLIWYRRRRGTYVSAWHSQAASQVPRVGLYFTPSNPGRLGVKCRGSRAGRCQRGVWARSARMTRNRPCIAAMSCFSQTHLAAFLERVGMAHDCKSSVCPRTLQAPHATAHRIHVVCPQASTHGYFRLCTSGQVRVSCPSMLQALHGRTRVSAMPAREKNNHIYSRTINCTMHRAV